MYDELILQAEHYYNINKYGQSLKIINEALAEQPNSGYALYLKAACLNDSGQHMEALESCEECRQFGYNPEKTHFLFAVIHMNLLDFAKSEQHLLETLRLNPQNVSAIAKYSLLMYQTGHIEKSDALMTKAMELDPMNEKVLKYRQEIEQNRGHKKTEQATFQDYAENADYDFDGLFQVGVYHYNKKQYKKAHEYFRQAFLLQPDNKNLLELLEDLDKQLSPMFFPMRIFWFVHPAMVWIGAIAIIVLLNYFKLSTALGIFCAIYMPFVIYTWLVNPLYKLFHRNKLSNKKSS
jgi:tetratricopeptide (TPR) repeat protein